MSKIISRIAQAQQLVLGLQAAENQTNQGIAHAASVALAQKPVYQNKEYVLSQVPLENWMPLVDLVQSSLVPIIAGRLVDEVQRKEAFVKNGFFRDPHSNSVTYRFKSGPKDHEFRLTLANSLENWNPNTKECSVRFVLSVHDKFVNVGIGDACRQIETFGLVNNSAFNFSTLSPREAVNTIANKACEMVITRRTAVLSTNVFGL